MAKVETLTDDFNDNAMGAIWVLYSSGGGAATVAETGGTLQVTPSTVAGAYGGYESAVAYDVTESGMQVQVLQTSQVGAQGAGNRPDSMLTLWLSASSKLDLYREGNNLQSRANIQGGTTQQVATAYNATNHAWWRIRHHAGVVYWEAAPDAGGTPGTFTTLMSRDTTIVTFSLTALRVILQAGVFETTTGTLQPTIFDNLNVPPPPPPPASAVVFRRTRSMLGARGGSRQLVRSGI